MKKSILTSLLVSLALGAAAQTEKQGSTAVPPAPDRREEGKVNPRGIYRLMMLIGKSGEVNSPYHQYKVCTDASRSWSSSGGTELSVSTTTTAWSSTTQATNRSRRTTRAF
ncbi:MAG: hypothetical protein J6V92_01060 [Bacteroidaceae bacterium]|nr:hypothetical protein [Bacteroidaceae bacterium]